jgi:hypothetical protein
MTMVLAPAKTTAQTQGAVRDAKAEDESSSEEALQGDRQR